MLCYELLKEKNVANDEWLYALEQSAAAPHETVTALAKKLWCVPADASQSTTATYTLTQTEAPAMPSSDKDSLPALVSRVQKAMDGGKVPGTILLRRFHQAAHASVAAWTDGVVSALSPLQRTPKAEGEVVSVSSDPDVHPFAEFEDEDDVL